MLGRDDNSRPPRHLMSDEDRPGLMDKVASAFGWDKRHHGLAAQNPDDARTTAGAYTAAVAQNPQTQDTYGGQAAQGLHPDSIHPNTQGKIASDDQVDRVAPGGRVVGAHAMSHGPDFATPRGAYGTQGAYVKKHANTSGSNYPNDGLSAGQFGAASPQDPRVGAYGSMGGNADASNSKGVSSMVEQKARDSTQAIAGGKYTK